MNKIIQLAKKYDLATISHYCISVAGSTVINFLPAVILTHLVVTDTYSNIVLVKTLLFTMVSFGSLGLSQAVIHYIHTKPHKELFSNTLLGALLLSIPSNLFILLGVFSLSEKTSLALTPIAILLLILVGTLQLLNFEIINWKRATNNSRDFAKQSLFRGLLQIIFITLTILFDRSVYGFLYGLLIAELFFVCFAVIFNSSNRQYLTLTGDFQLIKTLIRYGWPFAFVIVSNLLLNSTDRFLLALLQPNHSLVGVYDVAYTFAAASVGTFTRGYNLYIWPKCTTTYHQVGATKCIQLLNKMINFYLLLGSTIIFILILLGPHFLHWFFPPAYSEANNILPFIGLGTLFQGMINSVSAGLYFTNKTSQITYITIFAFIINLLLNLLLIPRWLLTGAAMSTLIAGAAQLFACWYLAKRYLPVKLPYLKLLLSTVIVYASVFFLPGTF